MIDILNIQPNKPLANFEDYKYVIHAPPKAGKTSLVHGITQSKFDGDLSKLLLVGFERGYNALAGIHAQDIEKWEDFQTLVKQLVEHKDKVSYKMLAIDTVDLAQKRVVEYVIKKQSAVDKKRYKALNDIPWGKGHELVDNEMSEQFDKLDKAGYSLFFITHSKDKKFESRDGVSYDKTTLTLSGRVRELILNMVDFICYIDIAKEQQGSELVDVRYIHFRGNSDLEAGSRFKDVPNKIEYDFDLFIKTVEDAILKSYGDNKGEMEKAKKEQKEEKDQKVNDFVAQEKDGMSIEDSIKFLDVNIEKLKKADKLKLKDEFEAILGDFNYRVSKDAEGLQECVNIVEGMLA